MNVIRSKHFGKLFAAVILSAALGCANRQVYRESSRPAVNAHQGSVFVIGGAGGYQDALRAVDRAVAESGAALEVVSFDWSHRIGLGLTDQVDVAHSRREGQRLAQEVLATHAAAPQRAIYLVSFSAGAAVVLAAGEALPTDSVDRVVLLAPAVSARHDIRPLLAAARGGVEAFTSERDRFWLGIGTGVVGTADGQRDSAAGRVGFETPGETPYAARLRQHFWDPQIAWTGNSGGHTGTLNQRYLQTFVIPLLTPAR